MGQSEIQNCIICGKTFLTEKDGKYKDRRRIPDWNAAAHATCILSNTDGIVPDQILLRRLEVAGITPSYNSHGWIVCPNAV
jgi:hypothetical protein